MRNRKGKRVFVSFKYSHPDDDHRQLRLFAEDMEVLQVSHHGGPSTSLWRFIWLELEALRTALDGLGVQRRLIVRPPGTRLDALASFFFSKRVYETVLRPSLAEMQEEYFESFSEQMIWKARWVWVRGIVNFWSAALLQLPVSITRVASKLWTISGA